MGSCLRFKPAPARRAPLSLAPLSTSVPKVAELYANAPDVQTTTPDAVTGATKVERSAGKARPGKRVRK